MIGNRSLTQMIRATLQPQHYSALLNMSRLYPRFPENLYRYLTGKGTYPYEIEVRTPVGPVKIHLDSHHDLLTVNEIFCRQDYRAAASLRHVLDLGSNIGISAVYFLTRNNDSKCTLYEPNPRNIDKLRRNLEGFRGRYSIVQAAVADEAGQLEFGIEPTGRYGGLGLATGESIEVPCLHINDVLRSVLRETQQLDILKIDTEGVEVRTVNAIDSELLRNISNIYLEATPTTPLHPELFDNQQYGSVRRLSLKQTKRPDTSPGITPVPGPASGHAGL